MSRQVASSVTAASKAAVDERQFKDLMAAVCAPVTVVTGVDGTTPVGATVSAFGSLSLEPRLVSVALDVRSGLLATLRATGRFGVNVLSEHQADIALRFASRGDDRFADVVWMWQDDLPRLAGATGWLSCTVHDIVSTGDHDLVIGEVVGAARARRAPLVYAERTFGTHSRLAASPLTSISERVASCAR
jgi:flavin reductase (DIM6/NTAB) family NADH-FMN oxidoreductase RutF